VLKGSAFPAPRRLCGLKLEYLVRDTSVNIELGASYSESGVVDSGSLSITMSEILEIRVVSSSSSDSQEEIKTFESGDGLTIIAPLESFRDSIFLGRSGPGDVDGDVDEEALCPRREDVSDRISSSVTFSLPTLGR
jgi:hypothetical protein